MEEENKPELPAEEERDGGGDKKPKKKMSKKKKRILIALGIIIVVLVAGVIAAMYLLFGGHSHIIRRYSEHPATCTKDGNITYYYCRDCGKYFSDMEGTNQISQESTVIPATGHNIVYSDELAPTCTDDGYKAHYYCTNCNVAFTSSQGLAELPEEEYVLPALGHDWDDGVIVDGDSPTCTQDGTRTHTCNRCSQTYTQTEPALGHDFSVVCTSEMEHWMACSRDGCTATDEDSRHYHDYVISSDVTTCSCGQSIVYSQGLSYELSADGSYYTVIGAGAFEGQNVFIPDYVDNGGTPVAVKAVGAGAFRYQASLKFVRLPSSVTSVGDNAFMYCTGLEMVTLSAGLQTIGDSAFYGCGKLAAVSIPASVNYIGADAFKECSALTDITFEQAQGWTDESGTPVADLPAALAAGTAIKRP